MNICLIQGCKQDEFKCKTGGCASRYDVCTMYQYINVPCEVKPSKLLQCGEYKCYLFVKLKWDRRLYIYNLMLSGSKCKEGWHAIFIQQDLEGWKPRNDGSTVQHSLPMSQLYSQWFTFCPDITVHKLLC